MECSRMVKMFYVSLSNMVVTLWLWSTGNVASGVEKLNF